MVANHTKALLHKDGIHWNNGGKLGNKNDMGQGAKITYSFMNGRPSGFSNDHYKNFTQFSSTQKAQIRKALDHYENVAKIDFDEVPNGGTIKLGYADTFYDFNGDGKFEPAGGLAKRPSNAGGSVVIKKSYNDFSLGSWGYKVLLHELGHAVGGFNDVTIGRNSNNKYTAFDEQRHKGMNGSTLSSWQDNRKYTVMSYNKHPDMSGVEPRTLMLYDIAALQTLYGANKSYNAGNNTYSWKPNETFIETIWDGGGTDTIDASNQTRRSIINLGAGAFSSIGSSQSGNALNNLAIAYDVTIENARGGSGNDRITGNNVRNVLYGNGGNDTIDGGAGNDYINGGSGNDYVIGGSGDDYMDGGSGIDTVDYTYWNGGGQYNLGTGVASFAGYYNEEIRNFENIKTGNGRDVVRGSSASNRIETGGGNDWISAGSGNDYIKGGSGNDYVIGGSGDDYMDGGSGIDTVDYTYWNGGGQYNLGTGVASFAGYYNEEIRNFENIKTGNGRDVVRGSSASNRIETGGGNDWISAGSGNDYIKGGSGNDYVIGGSGDDYMDGGSGIDTVDYTYWNGGGQYNLGTGVASFAGYYNEEIRNFENIKTGNGRDVVRGSSASNRIETGGGNDYVIGGSGYDHLYGGTGADTFRVDKGFGYATIKDYSRSQGDKVSLGTSSYYTFKNVSGGSSLDTVFKAYGTGEWLAVVEDTTNVSYSWG